MNILTSFIWWSLYVQIQNLTATSPHTTTNAASDGYSIAKNPLLNKGMSFSEIERSQWHLRGLYPAGDRQPLALKIDTSIKQMRNKVSPIEKYIYLHTIQDSDETLYYGILTKHTQEVMPFVYTPTVGQACQEWSYIYRHTPRGIYLSLKDKGSIKSILMNHPSKEIKAIVFTDGERILGLGDLGVNGMGIPIGKLALYTACAGIHPHQCLPVHIDVGTNTESIRNDPVYLGLRQPRDRSNSYDELIDEFFTACQQLYGENVLLQFEDFGNLNAFRLLDKYKTKANCFNDDIQGTAAVVLAGIIASLPLTNKEKLSENRYLFLGAGEAGIGIADLLSTSIHIESNGTISMEEARTKCFFFDSKGLLNSNHRDLSAIESHKRLYAHDAVKVLGVDGEAVRHVGSFLEAVRLVRPTAIIGVSAQGGAFTKQAIEEMMSYCPRPLIMALSNPTSKAECTALDAYTWTNGQCVFCSGSPFDEVVLPDGRRFTPGQGNNAYIFPGVGLGSIVAGARKLTDDDFQVAAATLAKLVSPDRLAKGCVYPPLDEIRWVSANIAAAVARNVVRQERSTVDLSNLLKEGSEESFVAHCQSVMYVPEYE